MTLRIAQVRKSDNVVENVFLADAVPPATADYTFRVDDPSAPVAPGYSMANGVMTPPVIPIDASTETITDLRQQVADLKARLDALVDPTPAAG